MTKRGATAVPAAALLFAAAAALAARPAAAASEDRSLMSADVAGEDLPETKQPEGKPLLGAPRKLVLPLGPLFIERSPTVKRTIVFPLVFDELKLDGVPSRLTGVFPFCAWRRADGSSALVVFPILWSFSFPDRSVQLVPPVYYEKDGAKGLMRLFVFPALFVQKSPELSFEIVPPVFLDIRTKKSSLLLTVLFYRWVKGENAHTGIYPLAFWGRKEGKGYTVALPLFWHFYDLNTGYSKTVVPPFYLVRGGGGSHSYGFVPLVFGGKEGGERKLTVLPLFHMKKGEGKDLLLVTPGVWYLRREAGDAKGAGVLLAHWYRSRDLDLTFVAPVYWGWSRPALMERTSLVFPLLYLKRSPVERDLSVLGLWWDFNALHEHRTFGLLPFFMHSKDLYRDKHLTWVFPTIQYQKSGEERKLFIHPVFYLTTGREKTYDVFFPLWWRFTAPVTRRTVAFPFWWDFADASKEKRVSVFFPLYVRYDKGDQRHQAFLLWYHWKGMKEGRKSWRFVFFPLLGFGRTEPSDYYWKFLFGFVGFERKEGKKSLYLFWIPMGLK